MWHASLERRHHSRREVDAERYGGGTVMSILLNRRQAIQAAVVTMGTLVLSPLLVLIGDKPVKSGHTTSPPLPLRRQPLTYQQVTASTGGTIYTASALNAEFDDLIHICSRCRF